MVRWTTLASTFAVLAACSDVSTGPKTMAVAQADKGAPTALVTLEGSASFTIVPGQATSVDYKRFQLDIPANALCADGSGYGRAVFDSACALETQPQTFQVKWGTDENNNIRIVFDRDARFAPGKMVSMMVRTLGELKNSGAILWYDGQAGAWVDEGTYDPSQVSKRSKGGTLMSRNLKHFSGYNVGAGETLPDPTLDGIEAALGLGF